MPLTPGKSMTFLEQPILRPEQPADASFLQDLYANTRAQELRQVPWSSAQKAAFLRMQFDVQTKQYHQQFPDAAYQIILWGTQPIGRMYVHRGKEEIVLIDIALRPESRGAGIGTRLLKYLQEEAEKDGKPLRIHVEQSNRALSLYRRLGFRLLEQKGIYYWMEWRAEFTRDTSSAEKSQL